MAFAVGPTGKNGVSPQMNVTPLVDVVLVLLIIFMVVTPLLSRQLSLSLPKQEDAKDDTPQDNTTIVLTVDGEGAYRVNDQLIDGSELEARLARMLAPRPDKVVYFDASRDAPYAAAVTAMDIAKRSGAKGVAILTESVVR